MKTKTKKLIIVPKEISPSLRVKLEFKIDVLGKEIRGWLGVLDGLTGNNKLYGANNCLFKE